MIVNKLENLFSDLNQEELNELYNSEVDMSCELDAQVVSRICDKVILRATLSNNKQ